MTDHKPTARERLVQFLEAIEPVADSIERGPRLIESLEAEGIDAAAILEALVAMDGGLYVDLGFPDAVPILDRIALTGLRLARWHKDIERMRRRTRGKVSAEQAALSARLDRVLAALEGFVEKMREPDEKSD